jgi:hypothetical protein
MIYLDSTTRANQIADTMTTYFHNQAHSALASILAWRALGMGISKSMSGPYSAVVPQAGEKIIFNQISISRDEIGQFFHQAVEQAAQILINKLLLVPEWWQEVQGNISLEQAAAYENIQNRDLHWNFLVPNPMYQRLQTWLYSKLLGDLRLGPKWFAPNGILVKAQKARYLQHLHDFQTILLVLVHATSGAPARGSEVPPILFSNTHQATRTLFIDRQHHQILIRLRYSKTANRTNLEQQAIRVLPESVSYLILAYLGLVLPFIRFLEVMEKRQFTRSNELLFWHHDALLNERVLGRKLKMLTKSILNQQINIQSWRHIMQGFIRYYLNWNIEDPWSTTPDG